MADNPPVPDLTRQEGAISPSRTMQWAGWVGGLVFIVLVLILALSVPNPTGFQEFAFRVPMSIGAAAFISFVPGFLILRAFISKQDKVAGLCGGGAIVVFILLMYVNPTRLGAPAAKLLGQPPDVPIGSTPTQTGFDGSWRWDREGDEKIEILDIVGSDCLWTEQFHGSTLQTRTKLKPNGNWVTIERPVTDEVLTFLEISAIRRVAVLAKNPPPNFFQLTRNNNGLVGTYKGIWIQSDPTTHLLKDVSQKSFNANFVYVGKVDDKIVKAVQGAI